MCSVDAAPRWSSHVALTPIRFLTVFCGGTQAEFRCVVGGTCVRVMGHHRALTSRVWHMQSAGPVAAREGHGYYGKKKRVQSHRAEGRRIAARLGGWWRLGLNWQRVLAVCLRAG